MRRRKGWAAFLALLLVSLFVGVLEESNAFGSQEPETSLRSLTIKGQSRRSAGEFEEAAIQFKDALELARAARIPREEAMCSTQLGIVCWDLGQISEAAKLFEESLTLTRICGDTVAAQNNRKFIEIIELYNLGKEYRSTNQNQKSLQCFERAIAIGRGTGIDDFELKCLRQKSLTYWQMDNIEEFFECNKRGLDIAKKINHRKEMGRYLNNLGTYFRKKNDYSTALKKLESALPILRTERDVDSEAECLNNIGVVYKDLGDFDNALLSMSRALEIDKKIGNSLSVSADLANIGTVYLLRGCANEDKQDLRVALETSDMCLNLPGVGANAFTKLVVLSNSGFAYHLLGQYEVALKCFFEALKIAKNEKCREEHCHIFNNIGNTYYKLGQIEKAILFYEKSINLSAGTGYLEIHWEAYYGLGRCYEAKKELSMALSYYRMAIGAMERIRSRINIDMFKISFARNKLIVYQHALDILYSLYLAHPSETLLGEIFLMIEKAKARAFVESLIEAKGDVEMDLGGKLIMLEGGKTRPISGGAMEFLRARIGEGGRGEFSRGPEQTDGHVRMTAESRSENNRIGGIITAEMCSISRIQSTLLNEKTALLEYFVGENRSFMFFITRYHAELYELPGRRILENSLRGYLKILFSPLLGPFDGFTAADRIAKELTFPLWQGTRSEIDSIIVVPDGVLHYLPFETLRIANAGKPIYVIEKFKTTYCPSATSLFLIKQRPRPKKLRKHLLAFGAPLYAGQNLRKGIGGKRSADVMKEAYLNEGFSLSPLPFSKNEILGISRHFLTEKKDIFLGSQANESTLKSLPLREYQIIHFACHGFLDEKFPLRSALVLSFSKDQDEDGFLQANEICNLEMNADLVVLSACQTGNGALEKGEGLIGLTRSFLYSGADSVLSSFWSLNDQSTAGFMEDFYTFLCQGQDKAGALRLAKLKMLKSSHFHPFYWAGFVLNGDSAPIQFDDLDVWRLN